MSVSIPKNSMSMVSPNSSSWPTLEIQCFLLPDPAWGLAVLKMETRRKLWPCQVGCLSGPGRAGQGASANCGNIQQSASSQAITPLQCNILYKALVYWPYSALFHPILWPYSRPSVAACSSVLSGRARWGQCALGTSSHCLKTTAMAAAPASVAGQN